MWTGDIHLSAQGEVLADISSTQLNHFDVERMVSSSGDKILPCGQGMLEMRRIIVIASKLIFRYENSNSI
jgi:hypothetical protein